MEIALIYRWAVFILLVLGLILLMKHGVLTPFVFWSRIQYYTFSTFTLFFIWLGATLFKADIPLYRGCRTGDIVGHVSHHRPPRCDTYP